LIRSAALCVEPKLDARPVVVIAIDAMLAAINIDHIYKSRSFVLV